MTRRLILLMGAGRRRHRGVGAPGINGLFRGEPLKKIILVPPGGGSTTRAYPIDPALRVASPMVIAQRSAPSRTYRVRLRSHFVSATSSVTCIDAW